MDGSTAEWYLPLRKGEHYNDDRVVSSVKSLIETYSRFEDHEDKDAKDQYVVEYLNGKQEDRVEFVMHPDFWNCGYSKSPEANFSDVEATRETGALNREKYVNSLSNRLNSSAEDDIPIFCLDSDAAVYGQNETYSHNFLEYQIGLNQEEYHNIPTHTGSGTIPFDSNQHILAILGEIGNFDAVINGEVNGLCTTQFGAILGSISETKLGNINIYEGEKFPRDPIIDQGGLLETDWEILSEIDEQTAKRSFQDFVKQNIHPLR